MVLTRGQLLDRVVALVGNDSTAFRTFLEGSLNMCLYMLWDAHDWSFKEKSGTVATVDGTESYNLSTLTTDLRTANDLDVVWDSTNKRFLRKVDLQEIRRNDPEGTQKNQPTVYAVWGAKTIFCWPIPDGAYTLKFLYTSKPTLPAADANDLETVCGLPDYMHPVLEHMLRAEGFAYDDDSRLNSKLDEVLRVWLPIVKRADSKHLESTARFKVWQEVYTSIGQTNQDYLRSLFWGNS